MVGVAGRSQGCLTCRARRKGCDRKRPMCGQCQRANIFCRGYEEPLRVVHYNHHGSGSTRYISSSSISTKEPSISPISDAGTSLLQGFADLSLVDIYWKLIFPGPNEAGVPLAQDNHSISSIFELGRRWIDDPLIKTGLRAVKFSAMARKNNSDSMAHTALHNYYQVLTAVNRCLRRPDQFINDNVLGACKLLAAYEAHRGVGFNWERHALGIQQLLVVRGPSSHVDGMAHSLFLDARLQITFAMLKRRERTALADRDWLQVPWQIHQKDLGHHLLDIMLKLPTSLAEFDAIVTVKDSEADTTDRRQRHFERCRDLYVESELWFRRMEVTIATDIMGAIKDGVPPQYSLAQFNIAFTMSLYWAFRVMLDSNVQHALRDMPVLDQAAAPDLSYAWCDPEPYALRIANSVGYFFQPGAGTYCAAMFAFPMGTALNYFSYTYQGLHPEYLKILGGFSAGKVGETTGKFLRSLLASADPMKNFDLDEDPSMDYEEQRRRAKSWYQKGDVAHVEEREKRLDNTYVAGPSVSIGDQNMTT